MSQILQSVWLLFCLALFGLFFFIALQTLRDTGVYFAVTAWLPMLLSAILASLAYRRLRRPRAPK